MSLAYQKLEQSSIEDAESLDDREVGYRAVQRSRYSLLWKVILVVSLAVNAISFVQWNSLWKQQTSNGRDAQVPDEFAEGVEIPTVYKQFWWNTEYSSMNETQKDELWNAILPSHGFVAVDTEWATERHYPESMYLPDDSSKSVYLLEAYHQLHCLKILRRTMKEAVNGLPYTWHPGEHIDHCFDTLRQTAMCNADSTPLYTFGKNTAGVGQLHKCRDWDALRQYATENTACYRDSVEDILLREHFGYCDDGNDGVIEGRPVTVKFD